MRDPELCGRKAALNRVDKAVTYFDRESIEECRDAKFGQFACNRLSNVAIFAGIADEHVRIVHLREVIS